MERVRAVAFQTVGRGVGFAGLAIFTLAVGLSFDPVLALRSAGTLALILVAVLVFKAATAARIDYRRTELWLNLDAAERPADAYAQWAASTALREAYSWFARWTAGAAAVTWGLALLLSLARALPFGG